MKKIPAYPVLFLAVLFLMFSPIKTYSQDFNLFNPTNEMYLFSAYDEGSNAFRYNPAVLGLGHRLNFTISALMHIEKFNGLNELDVSLNAGFLGLAYRKYTGYTDFIRNYEFNNNNELIEYTGTAFTQNYNVSTFSLGFGAGNKTITAAAKR